MNTNELFNFEKIDDYRGRVLRDDNARESEKFDLNKKLDNKNFEKSSFQVEFSPKKNKGDEV